MDMQIAQSSDYVASSQLKASYQTLQSIEPDDFFAMYSLFSRYYDGTSLEEFSEDFKVKSGAIILRDGTGSIQGFSTQEISEFAFENERYTVIFSGDTIVDHHHWGQQALNYEWMRFTGVTSRNMNTEKLYWFLIVKGHRTYRYLQAFYKNFYPAYNLDTNEMDQKLLHFLAADKYKQNYCANSGVVKFAAAKCRLKDEWAEIPLKDRPRPAVQYFLKRNPGYQRGDELACLCQLSAENHRPFVRRLFLNAQSVG
ncbi:MAG: hypothetical protein V7723_18850 [Sneathiella sp.]|uniref:hypothetical protein n=1 Tax=Sneathiella sp. TaxID=1964365 RepID=UPI0030018151